MANNKVAVVTGANTGLGYQTSLGLAKAGYSVILGCRHGNKAQAAINKIKRKVRSANAAFVQLDLVDRQSIRQFADEVAARHGKIDLLVNNAGVMGVPETITPNGLELHFDANHVGHFLLTALLFPLLDKADEARVINVSSLAGKIEDADIHFDNLNFDGIYNDGPQFMGLKGMGAYAQSKLANILFTMELKDRLEAAGNPMKALVVHPGVSNTDLSRNMPPLIRFLLPVMAIFMNVSSPAQGARPTLMAALDSGVNSGDFIGPTGKEERGGPPGLVELPPKAYDKALCQRLWKLSEELTGAKFSI